VKLSEIFAAAELAPDLRTLLLGPHAPEPDEWRRKRARGGGGHLRVPAAGGGGWRAVDFAGRSPSGVRPSAKAALASGAQPAVFKVISAAHGRTRVAALLEYLGTRVDEHGKKFDIPIVTQSGAEVATAEARAALLDTWSADFSQTPRARDVGIFVATIDVSASAERVRAALSDTFNGRAFIYALDNKRLTVAVALTARGQGLPTTGPRIEAMADRLAGHFPCQSARNIAPGSASNIDPLVVDTDGSARVAAAGRGCGGGARAGSLSGIQTRCLKRQLSLPVSTMSQWWVRRSSNAVVIFGSPKTLGHSPKARLVVTMTDVRS